jgi:hypothetical protein
MWAEFVRHQVLSQVGSNDHDRVAREAPGKAPHVRDGPRDAAQRSRARARSSLARASEKFAVLHGPGSVLSLPHRRNCRTRPTLNQAHGSPLVARQLHYERMKWQR